MLTSFWKEGMVMSIKVSVIVPVFNAGKFLHQCLETILGQTLREIEVIIIDDGSTDDSYKICQEFQNCDERIRLYKQKNKGAGATRNRGIQLARGEYLSFLDSDDFFELDMLQTLYRRAKVTGADISFCDYWEFNDFTKQNRSVPWSIKKDLIPSKQPFSPQDCPDVIFQLFNNAAWSSLYKKSFVLNNDIKFGLYRRSEDTTFTHLALVSSTKITSVQKKLLYHRININNSSTTLVDKYQYSTFLAFQDIYNYLLSKKLYSMYKKSFLTTVVENTLFYEISFLKYPLHFLSEAYFVDNIVSKYELDSLPENYFYKPFLHKQIKQCIRSNNSSSSLRYWYKERKNDIVPIVLATNDKRAYACGITIQSIIEHASQNRFYDIYILYTNLSKNMIDRLNNMAIGNCSITPIPIHEYFESRKFPLDSKLSHITQETYYRFYIPSIFSYDKVLWLDNDLVVLTDISKLYDIELKDNLVAGVRDILTDEEEEKRNGYGLEVLCHINAGILLINNKLWIKEEIQQKCMDEIKNPSHPWTLNDQDIINFICQDRILLLDDKWNFLCAAFRWKIDKYKSYIGDINPEEFYVIHYNGHIKPWDSSENNLSDIWWKYAQKSSFYQDILRQYIQNTIQGGNTPKKCSTTPPKQPKQKLDVEEAYQLRKAFIKKALGYYFSFGKKKQAYKLELDLINKKIKGV